MTSQPLQRRNALIVVGTCLLLLPLLALEGESLPSNNNVETWLPVDSQARREYDFFKESFGARRVPFDMYHSPSFTRAGLIKADATGSVTRDVRPRERR